MFSLDIDKFSKDIKNLPGQKVQYQMAPEDRADLLNKNLINEKTKKSAVLILLYKKNDEIYSVLTKRAIYDGHHSGQICLPGGKLDKDYDKTNLDTAIRETFEEVGYKINKNDIIGELTSLHIPVSNILVFPFIAYVDSEIELTPDNNEVKKIIEYKVSDLLNNSIRKTEFVKKKKYKIYIPYFNIENEKVWGATAMIINEFIYLLKKQN